MEFFRLFRFVMFIGMPVLMLVFHFATLSESEKHDLSEAAKDINGRIYTARINCPRSREDHFVRVHGRDREDALQKIKSQVKRCDVSLLEGESAPIWQEAIKGTR